jgi:hypothetical protein
MTMTMKEIQLRTIAMAPNEHDHKRSMTNNNDGTK